MNTPGLGRAVALVAVLGVALFGLGLRASEAQASSARSGLDLAAAAADAWVDDARLVWIENDAAVDTLGDSDAWGYLYYSASRHAMRSWSVRDGHIVHAEDQAVIAAAPALAPDWADSGSIAVAACKELGAETQAAGATLESLILSRGVFVEDTVWVAVFATAGAPRWFLLFDAKSGSFLKRWRG
jgi:hypothetical protein